jgi:hypothetical protein
MSITVDIQSTNNISTFALPPNGLRVIQKGTMHSYQDHDHGVFHKVNKGFVQSINAHVFVFQPRPMKLGI